MGLEVILMFAACAMASRAYPGAKENPKPSWYSAWIFRILGGGQLGRMVLQAGIDLNLYTLILDPDPDAPCKHLCQ